MVSRVLRMLTEAPEVFVRTTHLLLKLEEAQRQLDNNNGKSIVFGSYVGVAQFNTG